MTFKPAPSLALLLTALSAASAAADPGRPIAIVVARENPGSESHALAVVERLSRQLGDRGSQVIEDGLARERLSQLGEPEASSCQGRPVCLGRLASKLGARAIVAVEAAELHGTVAVLVEAIGTDASRLCSRELMGKVGRLEELDAGLGSFADELQRLLPERQPPAAVASARPEPVPAEALESSAAAGAGTRRVLGLGLDAAGALLLAAGAGFGLAAKNGYDDAREIADSGDPSRAGELESAKSRVKSRMLAADLLYGVGAVALASGLYLTFTTPAGPLTVAPAAGASLAITGGF